MIVLASLLASQLAPGCRQLERSLRCELAPPMRVAAPATVPPPRVADESGPPRRARPRADVRPSGRPETPKAPPTPAEIERHARLLVAIADCTGARTLLASTGDAAKADGVYRACLGLPPAPARAAASSGGDLGAVPRETASAGGRVEAIDHP